MFNVNFTRLVIWFTPIWLRSGAMRIFILSWTWPVRQLYNLFTLFIAAKLYRLSHNSQVFSIRAVLNDAFDNTLRRIYITDFNGLFRIYFWPETDRRDVDFSEVQFFWPDDMYSDSGTDFTIHLPIDLVFRMEYLTSLVDEYKLAGKQYNIVYE